VKLPLRRHDYCTGCRRYAVTFLASEAVKVFARGPYGALRPAKRRARPYLCFDCLRAMRLESEEDFIARMAREESEGITSVPEEWA
jgi:hypothetical protein